MYGFLLANICTLNELRGVTTRQHRNKLANGIYAKGYHKTDVANQYLRIGTAESL
jgi:hypothetical protein